MNENLLKYAIMLCVFIVQMMVVWEVTDNGTEIINIINALITGIVFGIMYVITWMKCPKLKVVKNKS